MYRALAAMSGTGQAQTSCRPLPDKSYNGHRERMNGKITKRVCRCARNPRTRGAKSPRVLINLPRDVCTYLLSYNSLIDCATLMQTSTKLAELATRALLYKNCLTKEDMPRQPSTVQARYQFAGKYCKSLKYICEQVTGEKDMFREPKVRVPSNHKAYSISVPIWEFISKRRNS